MKNIILGMVGVFIVIYTTMLTLSIYSVYVRKNQIEKCLATVLESAMDRYYLPRLYSFNKNPVDEDILEEEILDDIEQRLAKDNEIDAIVYICDMDRGIISAEINEDFVLPMGIEKRLTCTKTIVADREESTR